MAKNTRNYIILEIKQILQHVLEELLYSSIPFFHGPLMNGTNLILIFERPALISLELI